MNRLSRGIVFVSLATLSWLVACASGETAQRPQPAQGQDPAAELYAQHCALCHGFDGSGDGPANAMLEPRARDFGEGLFRIVSTVNGVPDDEDLRSVLRRGLPGSPMPGFDWMSEAELLDLAKHVRALAVERMAQDLLASYQAAGEDLDIDQAREVAAWSMTPGEPVAIPEPAVATIAVLDRGRELFVESCAACHGVDGRGRSPEDRWQEFGRVQWARDLHGGVLVGGGDYRDLVRRVVAGMPGAAMPKTGFRDPEDLRALMAYLQSLLPEDAGERELTTWRRLRAKRAVAAVPEDPEDLVWSESESIDMTLMPLAAGSAPVRAVRVAALHDGERIAIRLSWADSSRDDRSLAGQHSDGCAVQFNEVDHPPLFGMGSHERPVDIWHWAAFRFREVAGGLDLIDGPEGPVMSEPAPGELQPAGAADELRAEGIDERQVQEGALRVWPRYHDQRWQVVIVRDLVDADGGLELRPGSRVRISFAVWNGSNRDHRGRKSVSVWADLAIDD